MYATRFSAILKTPDGKTIEKGRANVSAQNHSVDFKSDFVPLFALGETVEILHMIGDEAVHSFVGEVYLSTRQMLRITSVRDEVLPGAEHIHALNTMIEAAATMLSAPARGKASLFRRSKPILPEVREVIVYSLSVDAVRFTCAQPFEIGQQVSLRLKRPTLPEELIVEVYQIIVFGSERTGHQCSIVELPESCRQPINEYVQLNNSITNKIF